MLKRKPSSFVLGTFENGEALLDFLISNEAVKAVPVVSTAIRLLEGFNDYRSRLLQNKLMKFLSEPSLLRSLEAQRLRGDILDNPDDLSAIGDTLFLVIEKVTDSEKPVILAKVYASLLDGGVTSEDFFLLAHCIDICALADLRAFIATRGAVYGISGASRIRLVSAGLIETESTNSSLFPSLPSVSGNTLKVHFSASDLGNLLINAMGAAESV